MQFRHERASPVRVIKSFDDTMAIKANVAAYRQMLLHRASLLFDGALTAALGENVYSMTLNIRGHFETTAAIGFLHKRLKSAKNNTIEMKTLGADIAGLVLGSKDPSIKNKGAPSPKQILSMLKDADKTMHRLSFKGNPKHNMLEDCYGFLCEFAHPNYHSNSVSFDVDTENDLIIFRHGAKMRTHESQIIEYLLISTPQFLAIYDDIPNILP